jgi:LPLT family lysophospholipid transporter-like MFS transporter
MNLGFYIIMAAQFFSSLADNALLVAAIALLMQSEAPSWLTPYLKFFFVISYVVLAPYVGAFADTRPKGMVMLIANCIKIVGCVMMLFHVNPLAAYALVGLGAAAYSPAKYGIVTEYLPHRMLVVANGWIEGLTVASIILGTVLGGVLISSLVSAPILSLGLPFVDTPGGCAVVVITAIYGLAAFFNLYVPKTGVEMKPLPANPMATIRDFWRNVVLLWKDHLGQISLAVTTLFWGAGATLQFIVIEWARVALGYDLSKAAMLQGITALGIACGAIAASMRVSLQHSVNVIPLGIAMGIVVIGMIFVQHAWLAMILMVVIGGLAGYFVVPMNALLQHRGHRLCGAGRSIAVQNFNENSSILVMIAVYSLLIGAGVHIYTVVVLFGLFVSCTMLVVLMWFRRNLKRYRREIARLLVHARRSGPEH